MCSFGVCGSIHPTGVCYQCSLTCDDRLTSLEHRQPVRACTQLNTSTIELRLEASDDQLHIYSRVTSTNRSLIVNHTIILESQLVSSFAYNTCSPRRRQIRTTTNCFAITMGWGTTPCVYGVVIGSPIGRKSNIKLPIEYQSNPRMSHQCKVSHLPPISVCAFRRSRQHVKARSTVSSNQAATASRRCCECERHSCRGSTCASLVGRGRLVD